ncbi:MAG: AsnC family transcriptional regulator [Chloroflexi bacterium]|nr:AsnC family transcriptional regulator [Chloroflexota bacterium]
MPEPAAPGASRLEVNVVDDLDKRLLNRIQSDFPLVARPYHELGQPLGLSEDEVIARMTALKAGKIVRQVSAIFDTKSLGYKSSLVAVRVDPARIAEAARIINEHPGVTHNYERNHEYNLWFTIAVPPTSDLEAVIGRLHEMIGAETTRIMYTLRLFKIGVNLDMTGERKADAMAKPEYHEEDRLRARDYVVDERDKAVIRALQEDLTIEARPFLKLAEHIGMTEDELFAAAQSLIERGFMRRMAAILYHRRAGFKANGMGVWAAPSDRVVQIGAQMGAFQNVSHCYQRPTYPDWPYNVFTMVHGRSVEECEEILHSISEATGVTEYISLYSTREYKKTRLRFYTTAYEEWEAKWMPHTETVTAT